MWIVLAFISAVCLGFYDISKKIALAVLLSVCIMLGMELLMVVLGLCGVVSVWFAMLMVLLARVGTLIYAIYFR